MKKLVLLFFSAVLAGNSFAMMSSGPSEAMHASAVDDSMPSETPWSACWIAVPQAESDAYGVYHFRKTFELDSTPSHFPVHVSADNRYKLYVNGVLLASGPSRCDIAHWNYETVDIAGCLHKGTNVVAAVVWNYAELAPAAQISLGEAGFLLQGVSDTGYAIDTDSSWKCMQDMAYSPISAQVRGYFAAGPGELLDGHLYPWGWNEAGYDDSGWQNALCGQRACPKGIASSGERQLVHSPVPMSERIPVRFRSMVCSEGITLDAGFPQRPCTIIVPANSSASILLDYGEETTGYPVLKYSYGRDASISIGYAEALYLYPQDGCPPEMFHAKGDRNDVQGKYFTGYEDRIIADGGKGRTFEPLWWRTWRYVRIMVDTGDEPLMIDDVSAMFSAYPFRRESRFEAPECPDLEKMLDIGWRTARLCANETYMDCPYYEQMQYFGDSRIQALVTLYNTRDTCMVRQLLEHGRWSMLPDGLPQSRYPSGLYQVIPPFAVWWMGTAHDWWMMRGDEKYLSTLLPSFRQVLSWFERYLGADRLLHDVPEWFFIDWPEEFDFGQPRRSADGTSAYQDAVYLLGLGYASDMERTFGDSSVADRYDRISSEVEQAFVRKYWDSGRQLFADTGEHDAFSQHVNSMAVLAGLAHGEAASGIMERVLDDPSLIQSTFYFRFYVFRAMAVAGLGCRLYEQMQPWRDSMAAGMTTWGENPDPARSDCHAWSASPNVEIFRTMLGIDSISAGFGKVRIAPAPGSLKRLSGTVPHPKGEISVSFVISGRGTVEADISLPDGIDGEFVWHGRTYPLHPGSQTLVAR